jgi:hypothetical protein
MGQSIAPLRREGDLDQQSPALLVIERPRRARYDGRVHRRLANVPVYRLLSRSMLRLFDTLPDCFLIVHRARPATAKPQRGAGAHRV